MKRWILIGGTMLMIIAAGAFGAVNRKTYTEITKEKNYLEQLQVAEIPGELAVSSCSEMEKNLPALPIILRVQFLDEVEYLFGTSRQKVCVQEVYAGDSFQKGDVVYVTAGWNVVAEDGGGTAELGFVNLPKADSDYLIFVSGELEPFDKSLPVYQIYDETPITPIFAYEEVENLVVPVGEESTYVPYTEVEENEFFSTSEEGMNAWKKLKGKMLEAYPKGL